MAKTETGWTSEWYKLPDGVYWWRFDEKETPVAVRIFKSHVYGFVEDQGRWLNTYGGEFLGPLSPADAEQLHELRRLVREFLTIDPAKDVAQWCEIEQQLERAVCINTNPKQPEKETQGK